MPIYTKTLPDLSKETRAKAYEGLEILLSHLDAMNNDLLSVSIDTLTRIVTVSTTNALNDDELDHFGLL